MRAAMRRFDANRAALVDPGRIAGGENRTTGDADSKRGGARLDCPAFARTVSRHSRFRE